MGEPLFRLMKKLPDGSYEVVGLEKKVLEYPDYGKPEHKIKKVLNTYQRHVDANDWRRTIERSIIHDRADQYTGVDMDGAKVFERDRINIDGIKRAFTIQYHAPAAMWVAVPDLVFIDGEPRRDALVNYLKNGKLKGKIIGIEGVKIEK